LGLFATQNAVPVLTKRTPFKGVQEILLHGSAEVARREIKMHFVVSFKLHIGLNFGIEDYTLKFFELSPKYLRSMHLDAEQSQKQKICYEPLRRTQKFLLLSTFSTFLLWNQKVSR
jgi:hypothetical protein